MRDNANARTLDIRLTFHNDITEEEARHLTQLIAEEFEFGNRENHHFRKRGWGIGRSLIVKVERLVNDGFGRLLPDREPLPVTHTRADS